MKQTASNSLEQSPTILADMNTLITKMDKAEKAALKALADFEKKQSAYKEALHGEHSKNILLQIWSAMKIAKLTCKIKRIEYKLAKSEYRFAKKAAKKAVKENAEVVAESASQSREKKGKTAPKTAA
jgi:hypothetical protein